ncbi:obscurin-like [Centruroides vittatus]|uniref:obscurin-like n=1 Tax=Centruroides vittatus TaxID=120091 RepID=UPI00350FA305
MVRMSVPPTFLHVLPPETEATDGDIVTFQVKVSGDPLPLVSWLHCGECVYHVPGRREIIHHPDGWHELILTNITQYDDGEYECRAENRHGQVSSYGSLYYYDEGEADSTTEGTVEGTSTDEQGDTRLLILIDDGSETEGEEEDGSYRKSLSASEQIQSLVDGFEDVASTGTLEYTANDVSEEHQFSEAIDDSTSSLSALSPDQVVPEVEVLNNFGCGIALKAPLEYADISKGKTIRDRNDVVSLQLVADSYTRANCNNQEDQEATSQTPSSVT